MDKNKASNKKKSVRKCQKSDRHQNETRERLDNLDPSERKAAKTFAKRSLQQPESRLGDLDDIWQETTVGQDFETLVNAPLSADGHFVFKSEKNWMLDASKYDDFFSVDVKNLAMIFDSIPFNKYVKVDDSYFTKDELTDINNTAEKGRKTYEEMIEMKKNTENIIKQIETDSLRKLESHPLPVSNTNAEGSNNPENFEEDLDFLLSLKEPVRNFPVAHLSVNKSGSEESKTKTVPPATKSIDLEKWLDLVLEE